MAEPLLLSYNLPFQSDEALRALCDRCRDRNMDKAVIVLAGTNAEKQTVSFACYCTDGAIKLGANAGAVVREVAALCGGKGGGRPDMAMAGGKDMNKTADAMAKVHAIVGALVKG